MRVLAKAMLCLLALLVEATALAEGGSRFYFQKYDIEKGLSQNTVFCILQDHQGFMWFGTKDGLNRFDGDEFRTFIRGNHDEYSCSFVSNLYEASDGQIWIGTDKGVCIYNSVTEQISPFAAKTENGGRINSLPVSEICEDAKGRIWIVQEGPHVFSYDAETKKLKEYPCPFDKVITGLAFSDTGRIWIGTFGGGLYYTDDLFRTLHLFVDVSGENPFPNQVVTNVKMHSGLLYVSTEFGLSVLDPSARRVNALFCRDEQGRMPYVRDFVFSEGMTVWIGTETGLYVYDLATNRFNHYMHSTFDSYSLSDNAIYSIAKDREGGMWIGTYFGGVCHLPQDTDFFEKFYQTDNANSLCGKQVREFCKDAYGRIWVGTEDAGLNCYDPQTGTFSYVEGSRKFNNVHGLCADGDHLWVGTFSHGLKILDVKTGAVVKSYSPNDGSGLNSDYVFRIYKAKNHDIYIGTMSGLQRYDRTTNRWVTVAVLKDVFVDDVLEDSSGNLWVAAYTKGLYKREASDGKWRHYESVEGDSNSIPSNRVVGIYEDSHRRVWVMTQSGICSYRPLSDDFDRSVVGLPFPPGVVYQMQEDNSGNFWLSTNHGLYSVDPGAKKMAKYTTSDGLLSNQFNYRSSFKAADGTMYFGCIGGFVSFMPQSFSSEAKLPPPTFVEMRLFNHSVFPGGDSPLAESISLSKKIVLGHDQNSLSFKVETLSYSNLSKQRMKYKLEGFDHDWIYLQHDHRISYSNLGYGTYVLKVVSYIENDEENGAATELKIVIRPPFYLSGWAYGFYSVMLVVALFFISRYVQRRNLQRSERRIEAYKQEKEKEMYDAKIEFFTNVAHEIRTPLSLIKAPLENVIAAEANAPKEVKDDLDVMNMNVDRLLFLTNQLLDFRKIESRMFKLRMEWCNVCDLLRSVEVRFSPTAELSGRNLRMHLPATDMYAYIDKEAFIKIVSNLFTNAIKYGDSYIEVDLCEKDGNLRLAVRNDGALIPADMREVVFTAFSRLDTNVQNGAGIGLSFARSLAQLMGGSLVIEPSEVDNEFVLTLPLRQEKAEEGKGKSEVGLDAQISSEEDGDGGAYDVDDSSVSVLVVEDSHEMRKFLEKHLSEAGYRVFVAMNGVEALKVLSDHAVNLIVSDVMMPEMDGIELLKRVKSDLMYSHIPVILLTAKTQISDKIEGLESGADAYIDKPFSMRYLIANIAALIRNTERLRESFGKQPFATTLKTGGLSKMDEEFLKRLNEVILQNYMNPDFSMDEVVEIMNMSRSSFYRKIKGILNLTPNDYIRLERLKKAAELLKEGKMNVTEICYAVGFNSPSYFAKCFYRQYGVLPKDFE